MPSSPQKSPKKKKKSSSSNDSNSFASQLVQSATDQKSLRRNSLMALAKEAKSEDKSKANSTNNNISAIYIADDAYSWLPARIVTRQYNDDPQKVQVSLSLPLEWHTQTVLSPESTILELEDASSSSLTRVISLKDYPRGELPLQNITPKGLLLGKRDMADLPFLHEAAILYNLKERHATQHPYTRVGDIVVAMNPFTWIPGLYSQETQQLYAKNLLQWDDNDDDNSDSDDDDEDAFTQYTKLGHDPHVYETSCLAYRGLVRDARNQTILVTGESGAGKTETVKIVMRHLATLDDDDGSSVENDMIQRVLESNPVFEAFGNAKTQRNDNSSRFGKFTQLQFGKPTSVQHQSSSCPLAGSICDTYLLEKSRVVSHSKGERSYHVFYQLLQAPNDEKCHVWSHLDQTDLESFLYLGNNTEYDLLGPGVDQEEWPETKKALAVFQYVGPQLRTLLRALCAVLQLGNLQFEEDPNSKDSEEGGTIVSSREELTKTEDILGISAQTLEACMTTKNLKTGYDVVQVRLSPTAAKDATDALAKEIYARIFHVLVTSINEYTQGRVVEEEEEEEEEEQPQDTDDDDEDTSAGKSSSNKEDKFGVICLLDIFGFERFQTNRFEQLCINYANEHLQHKYVLDNFRQVQEEYESEGIELFDFAVVDNSDVLKLLENRLGILISLNEECVRPKGNDESFVYKIKIVNKDHDRIIDKKLHRKTEFGIRHFAGPVTYNAEKFVERNTDKLPDDLIACVATESSNELISREFQKVLLAQDDAQHHAQEQKKGAAPAPGRPRRQATNRTVLQKFRLQLKSLMNNIQDTTTRYIRCIKPNDNMTPKMTDHYTTMRQLECAGLVTAITISRETFPNRLGYDATHERFDILMTKQDQKYMSGVATNKEAVEYMLSNLLLSMVDETQLTNNGKVKMPFACGNTRVYFRAGALEFLETKRLEYYTKRVVILQNWIRRIQTQVRYQKWRQAAISIQAVARRQLAMQKYQEIQRACIVLSCWIRKWQATALVQSLRRDNAAVLIQNSYRSHSKAHRLMLLKKAVVVIQRAVRNRDKREKFTAKLAVAVEEARMDNKLLGLKKEVSDTNKKSSLPSRGGGMKGRQVNEQLLQEVETMFDYLRKEIFVLRGKNSGLKAEVDELDQEKRELVSHAESAEASATANRLQVTKIMKATKALSLEIVEHKQENTQLRKELKAIGSERTEEVASVKVDYERLLQEKYDEIEELKTTLKRTKKKHTIETLHLQESANKADEKSVTEIMRLKDELRRTQESHHDYLAKLMDVLETTHQAREQETARISNELMAVKDEKDSQIQALQREVDTLRRVKRAPSINIAPTATPDHSVKVNEVTLLRRELERTSGARQERSQKFLEVSHRLMSAVSPDNLVAITSARRGRGKSISVVEEETIRMKKMVRFLGDLYSLEETSQAKVDSDLLRTMDTYMAALEPNVAINKMELSMQQMGVENKHLKEQVLQQGACPRCEARDKRRMNRNRSNRSDGRSARSNDSMD